MPPRKHAAAARNGAVNPIQGKVEPPGDAEVRQLQAAVEGAAPAPAAGTVTFLGRNFRVADDVGLMPLLKFAHAADGGMRSEDLSGMAAMYAMIRDCVHPGAPCDCGAEVPDGQRPRDVLHRKTCGFDPGDWDAFEAHAIDERADGDDLFEFVGEVIELVSARPTRRRSGSMRAAPSRSPRSKARLPAQADALVSVEALVQSRT